MGRGKYTPMRREHYPSDTISHLTEFGPWKRVNLTLNLPGRSLPTKSTPPLQPPSRSTKYLGEHNVVPQVVIPLYLIHNIRLYQQHQAVVPNLHVMDLLGKAKASAVPDVVRSKVETWGRGGLRRGSSGAAWIRFLPWWIGRFKHKGVMSLATSPTHGTQPLKSAPYPLR